MRIRIVLKCLAAFLFVFELISCARANQVAPREDTLARIRRTGVIDGCTFVYPPLGIKDAKTGAYSGVYVDALKIIAEKMNARIIWHEITAVTAVADLVSGRCDVVLGLFDPIPRALSVAFTQPALMFIGEGAVVRKDDKRFADTKDIFQFDRSDLTIALLNGESGDIFVREHFRMAQTKRIDADPSDQTRFCVEVSAKRADVAIADSNTLALYANAHPEVLDLYRNNPFGLNPVNWAVRQDDTQWLHFLETALQFLDTQGTLAELEKKYNAHFLHQAKQYKLQ